MIKRFDYHVHDCGSDWSISKIMKLAFVCDGNGGKSIPWLYVEKLEGVPLPKSAHLPTTGAVTGDANLAGKTLSPAAISTI